MAYVLGSLSWVEALLEDIHDLQSVISEYVSHLGPLNCPSWKYPDQLAGDVNIDQLLTQYTGYLTADSNLEDDARQMAHLALYELVIDRYNIQVSIFVAVSNNCTRCIVSISRQSKSGLSMTSVEKRNIILL